MPPSTKAARMAHTAHWRRPDFADERRLPTTSLRQRMRKYLKQGIASANLPARLEHRGGGMEVAHCGAGQFATPDSSLLPAREDRARENGGPLCGGRCGMLESAADNIGTAGLRRPD